MDIVFTVSPERLAKAMVKGHWRTGKDGKKHWVRDYHDKRGKAGPPAHSIRHSEAGAQLTVSAKPGTEFGPQAPEGVTLEELQAFHHEVMLAAGYDPATRSFAPLNRLGIKNRMVQEEGYGAWDGVEPNFRLRLPDADEQTAGYVAALMGRAFDQDAVAVLTNSPEGVQFRGLVMGKPDGGTFTPAEIDAIDKALRATSVGGDAGLETTADNRGLKFTNYGQPYEGKAKDAENGYSFADHFAAPVLEMLQGLGYDKSQVRAYKSRSYLVMREEYDGRIAEAESAGGVGGRRIRPDILRGADAQFRHAYDQAFAEREPHGWRKSERPAPEPEPAAAAGEPLGKSLILFT